MELGGPRCPWRIQVPGKYPEGIGMGLVEGLDVSKERLEVIGKRRRRRKMGKRRRRERKRRMTQRLCTGLYWFVLGGLEPAVKISMKTKPSIPPGIQRGWKGGW